MVYKVCEFEQTPRIKRSEEPSKTTIPGSKKVIRAFNGINPVFDVLLLDSEPVPTGCVEAYDRITGEKVTAERAELISKVLFEKGKPVGQKTLNEQR
jgi:nicotinic acid phosphoribosyltransferase